MRRHLDQLLKDTNSTSVTVDQQQTRNGTRTSADSMPDKILRNRTSNQLSSSSTII